MVLESFGLDTRAAAVYQELLRRPAASPAELSAIVALPTPEVQAALDRLASLNLVRPSLERPEVARAVPADVGLGLLLAQQEADLSAKQQLIAKSRAALRWMVSEQVDWQALGAHRYEYEEVKGLDAVRDRLESLAAGTQEEVLTFAPGGGLTAATRAASQPLNEQLLGRGVRMRTIYLNSVRNDPGTRAHSAWLNERGAEVRTVPVLPLRMLIIDRDRTVLPLDPEHSAKGIVVVRGAAVLVGLCALFEQLWVAAAPFGQREDEIGEELTADECAVVKLMMLGHTDEQAARKLGVSTRTVGRIASSLMARLGARSRFEFGAMAVKQGWLTAE